MALRSDCFGLGGVIRLAAAALISGSALVLAGAPAEAHRARHHYATAPRIVHSAPRAVHVAHRQHYVHTARYARHGGAVRMRQTASGVQSSPAFSALVVDANSGRTLYSVDEDGLRHPASITKVMTLYLLFEQLDRGAMTLRTEIPVSEHAAAQEPSKLGLRPGETIAVDDAIKAVVTRSANDVAVAIAEALGRSEDNFAAMMTRKARELGMANTLYRNASGLPNDEQVTTAHDLAILGRSLEERFPRYFRYFQTAEFQYGGRVIGNHNHLLGRVDGVDGIKTGYTKASGFNLLTSVHRDGRSLVAVVMGGRSAAGRDRIMENLIEDHLAEASTSHIATAIADGAPNENAPPRETASARSRAPAIPVAAAADDQEAVTGEGDDVEGDDSAPASTGTAGRTTPLAYAADPALAARSAVAANTSAPAKKTAAASDWQAKAAALTLPPSRRESKDRRSAKTQASPGGASSVQVSDQGGWMIQIGAAADPAKANALLTRARERNRSTLAEAKPVTQKVQRGVSTLYRARFAMLDSASAEQACRSLKRNGFSCFPAHD